MIASLIIEKLPETPNSKGSPAVIISKKGFKPFCMMRRKYLSTPIG